MGQFVPPEITVASEDLGALVALVGLMVSVGEEVGLEVGALVEAALAHRALVWRLLHVEDLVNGQGPRLAEPLPALHALERFFLRMNVSVVSEMILATESFAANITGVGALVGVRALVDEQVVRFCKLPVAKLAHKLFLWTTRAGHRSL